MAYTSAPETQTYSTQRIPAYYSLNLRGLTGYTASRKDEGMMNLIPHKNENELGNPDDKFSEIRAPILAARLANTTETVRGVYVWEKTSSNTYYFCVAGTSVYTSTNARTWTAVTTLSTAASTPVGFTEFIDSTNTKKLVLVDGIEGYVFTSNAAGTKIVDVDFPSPHLPFPVFIDGYLFLAKKDTGDIYNSDLNDPAVWTAGSFISSELYPDDLTSIVKVNNYLLAIGKLGCEFFYDAANATGSPLARYEGGSLPFGCPIPYSIAVNKNTVVMLANNSDGEVCLKIIEDFKHKDISPRWLLSLINLSYVTGPAFNDPDNFRGFFIRQDGELMYVLRLNAIALSGAVPATFAYCFSTNSWIELRTSNIRDFSVSCTTFGTSDNSLTFVGGNWTGTNGGIQQPFFGTFGVGPLYYNYITNFNIDNLYDLNGAVTLIGSEFIYFELRTPNLTFDTLNQKYMHRIGVEVTGMVNQLISSVIGVNVSWSDDDYTTYSSNLFIDTTPGTDFPFVTQCGRFRQRSLKFTGSPNQGARFRTIHMDINKGQQ